MKVEQEIKKEEKEILEQLQNLKTDLIKFVKDNSKNFNYSVLGSLKHISDELNEVSKFIAVR